MLENRMNPFDAIHLPDESRSGNIYARQYNTALNQFRSALVKGKIFRLKRKVLNRKQDLYDLNALKPGLRVRGSCYSGIRVVAIGSIIGSEGRAADFDMDFHPLSEDTKDRWVGIAVAHLSRLPLPPIQLIQIGNAYFVRDGHHRISVGRAFGQIAMDAEVIAWQAAPPFPWEGEALTEVPSFRVLTYPLDQ